MRERQVRLDEDIQVDRTAIRGQGRRGPVGPVLIAALFLWVAMVGCAATPKPPPTEAVPGTYLVGPPDTLLVNIYPDPIVAQTVIVRIDGKISVDLIGDVQAEGRTTQEIAAEIQSRISRYKRNAVVTVSVTTAASKTVTMFGEMGTRGGVIVLTQATRIAEAVGLQGGTSIFARRNKTRIIRSDGVKTQVITVRLADIQGGDLSTNVLLKPGDIVVVPPNFLALVGYTFQLILFPFAPLTGAANIGLQASGFF